MTPPRTAPLIEALDAHFQAVADRDRVPGIAYGVMLEGRLAHAGGVGTVRALGGPSPGGDTRSRICSMTKSFVSAAVLMLRDEGRLRLDDAVADHVPELADIELPTDDSPRITVRDLLSMAAGLPEDDGWADRLMALPASEVDEVFRGGASFARPPRIAYEYSNLGWVVLGRVVKNVAGVPVQDWVTEKILRPLGLRATTWDIPHGAPEMIGHRWQDEAWSEEIPPLADGDFAPMAGLWSTAEDLVRWMSFLADAFPPRDGAEDGPLSRGSRREMQQVHRAAPSEYDAASGRLAAGGYGFGLAVLHDLRFGHIVSHPGGLPGFGSYMRWLPNRGVGVVALGNSTYAPMGPATLEALEILDDLGFVPDEPALAASAGLLAARDGILRLLEDWSDDEADALFSSNVYLDEDRGRRRAHLASVRALCGRLAPGGQTVASSTRGSFRLSGDLRDAELSVMLSPEVPPRLMWYALQAV